MSQARILLPDCLWLEGLKRLSPTAFKELAESPSGCMQGQIRPVLIIAEYNFPDSLTAIKRGKRATKGGMKR